MASTFSKNPQAIQSFMKTYNWLTVYAGTSAVDIFFFLSGFLASYLIIGKVKKMKPSVLNYLKFLLHRFFRIWPAYVFCIFIFLRIAPTLGNGPLYFQYANQSN